MANEHMKKCSTSLVLRELQIKITVRYDFTHTRMTIKQAKPQKKTGIGEEIEKLEPLYLAYENIKWCSFFGKQMPVFKIVRVTA